MQSNFQKIIEFHKAFGLQHKGEPQMNVFEDKKLVDLRVSLIQEEVNELKDASGDFQLNGQNEHLNMYMRINLPEEYIKFFSYEFGFYYMKMKVPGGTLFGDKGTLWANTGISKSLFDDRASISFSINNIFCCSRT